MVLPQQYHPPRGIKTVTTDHSKKLKRIRASSSSSSSVVIKSTIAAQKKKQKITTKTMTAAIKQSNKKNQCWAHTLNGKRCPVIVSSREGEPIPVPYCNIHLKW